MKLLITLCLLLIAFSSLHAQETTITAKFKDAVCTDAACECQACFYVFVTDKGEEFVFNSISAENPDYTLLFKEVYGRWETNTENAGKNFTIKFNNEACQCVGFSETGEPMPVDVPIKSMLFFALK